MSPQHGIESVSVADLPLPRYAVSADQNAGGEPSVGTERLFTVGAMRAGVWEMGVGGMYDTEIDEVFVVLAGEGVVEVLDTSGLVVDRTVLRPGVACRLVAGTRTRWTVTRTLRKFYAAV